ncbi:sensor histidine kinase [Streptomyces sp. 8L]|uniref:sensor histidine kinase n=1 Tax=Streptomyces sp. 8L TaxID=2877242 RepID=UPI001CD52E51|nr:sensor histidine kinase [Streptomyces sp. 8L]MCA1221641.1 CHASE3 domain-containing protein [Streptomyces sp. 8L]
MRLWRFTREKLSVQGWSRLILAAMAVVVCGCAAVGGVLISQTNSRSDELTDRIQPARAAVLQLQKSLLDQETGVRGYALTGDPSFLQPYTDGVKDERRFTAAVHHVLAGDPELLGDTDAITRAAANWRREVAGPLISQVRSGGKLTASGSQLNTSKTQFDGLRKLFATQGDHLDAARDRARARLDHSRQVSEVVLLAMLAVFVVAVAALALLLHFMVGKPLNQLRAASDGVRAGAFGSRIEVMGPSDLRAVGAAVEAMRARLVEELEAGNERETLLADQTEELRRSNSELEQFAYVASHDLQEPLRKVASFCQLLEKRYGERLDDRGKQYIDFAVDGAKRMQVLINDLLTFSRVGRVHDAWQAVDLDATLTRALGNLAMVIEENGVTVVREAPLPEVHGDPTTLAMLWQNLVGNAVKFRSPERDPRIVIDCVREDPEPGTGDGPLWHFSVTDNGIGVAPEFAEKVFVIFQRLHARDEYEGTGIGLALCRKIVEFHGGRIWLEPVPTGGTALHFVLPAESADQRADERPAAPAAPVPATIPPGAPS